MNSTFEIVTRELHAKLIVDSAMRVDAPVWSDMTARPTPHSTEGTTGVEDAGGTGEHGRASRRGAERSEVA